MNFFTDYRAGVSRVPVGPLYDGLDAVEEKVFKKDRARMKLRAIPPQRRRVLYGLEKELDPDLQLLQRDDPRAYYQNDKRMEDAHSSLVRDERHKRAEELAADPGDLLASYPTDFKHKGKGVLKAKKDVTINNDFIESGDILVPIPGGRMKNIGAIKNTLKRSRKQVGIGLLADRTDAKLGYYSPAPVSSSPLASGLSLAPAAPPKYPVLAPGI